MPWKHTFGFAVIAQFLGILGFSFAIPFLPFFVGELGVEDAGQQAFWAGIVMAVGSLSFALTAPVWGILADRFGRKTMVVRAMFCGALVILLMSFARTVPQLVMCRVLQGVFSGTIAASMALVASVVPLHRSGFALGMMQASVFVGNASGPLLGGMAADAFGYRISFRLGAALTLLGGLLTLFGTKEHFTPVDRKSAGAVPGFRALVLLPGFLLGSGILFSVRLSNSISNPSFPLIVRDLIDTPGTLNSITGSIIAAAAIAAAASAAMLGHIGDRLGRRQVLVGCCLGTAAVSAGMFFVERIPTLFVMRVLFGFAVAGMMPAANAMIHAVVDSRAVGKAYGLATSLSMMGGALGPTLGGLLAMHAGIRAPFLVTAGAQICLVIIILMFFRKPPVLQGLNEQKRIDSARIHK